MNLHAITKWRLSPSAVLKGSLLLALILLATGLDWQGLLEQGWTPQRAHTLPGALQVSALMVLATALGTPRQLVAFAAGYLFGATLGTLLSTAAATAGAVIAYLVARLILAAQVQRFLSSRWSRLAGFLRENTLQKTLAVRLFPVGNNLATNLIAGSCAAPPAPFFTGSFLGYLPQMLLFALTGSGVAVASTTRIVIGLILFALSTMISAILYRNSEAHQALEARP